MASCAWFCFGKTKVEAFSETAPESNAEQHNGVLHVPNPEFGSARGCAKLAVVAVPPNCSDCGVRIKDIRPP